MATAKSNAAARGDYKSRQPIRQVCLRRLNRFNVRRDVSRIRCCEFDSLEFDGDYKSRQPIRKSASADWISSTSVGTFRVFVAANSIRPDSIARIRLPGFDSLMAPESSMATRRYRASSARRFPCFQMYKAECARAKRRRGKFPTRRDMRHPEIWA